MPPVKKEQASVKSKIHPRNRHRERYDFDALTAACPELAAFVQLNIHGDASIDFANPAAVKVLNKALLSQYYGIQNWDIPAGYLCPPIPGRADYIHYMADLMCGSNYGKMPSGKKVVCLDIGIGANCVYPIIGIKEYGWSFIGSDIDAVAIESANRIIAANPALQGMVECRLQPNPGDIFRGILDKNEVVDLSVCNPPFHDSPEAAREGTQRKLNNLAGKKVEKPVLNFGGQNTELWCAGGESGFVLDMIRQSREFGNSCYWFSSLISKQSNLPKVYAALAKADAMDVHTIPMGQGNKTSRIIAWTFLDKAQQKAWKEIRWKMK